MAEQTGRSAQTNRERSSSLLASADALSADTSRFRV